MEDVSKLQEELFGARQSYAQAQRVVGELTGQLQDSKEENSALTSQLRQHQQIKEENRKNAQKVDELEGHLAAKDAENKRLKGRNQLIQEELAELRTTFDSKNLEASQAQGSAALHKSKLDEQAAQILLLKKQLLEMEEEVAAAEGDAQAARAALEDMPTSDRTRFPQSDSTASTAAVEEANVLRAANAELQNRAAYLEEQLIQRDRLLESMPQASEQATSKTSGAAVQAYAPEDVLALSTAAIEVMPSQSLRGALVCATDLLRSHNHKYEAAAKRDDHELVHEVQRMQQEVSALAASLKEAEMTGDVWQAQAQSALGQIERLKEMLTEGANWEGANVQRAEDSARGTEIEQAPAADTDDNSSSRSKLQQLAMKHAAEAADLELVVRSLLAEGLRGQEACCQIGRVSLPALYAIESRLLELTS